MSYHSTLCQVSQEEHGQLPHPVRRQQQQQWIRTRCQLQQRERRTQAHAERHRLSEFEQPEQGGRRHLLLLQRGHQPHSGQGPELRAGCAGSGDCDAAARLHFQHQPTHLGVRGQRQGQTRQPRQHHHGVVATRGNAHQTRRLHSSCQYWYKNRTIDLFWFLIKCVHFRHRGFTRFDHEYK